jgi:hypothetical protein
LKVASSRFRNARPVLGAVVVIGISFYLFGNGVSTKSAALSDPDVGTLADAEEITVFLKSYLQPEDRVVAVCPSDCPLEFYFRKHGIPCGHLVCEVNSSARVLIVINKVHRQTLTAVLNEVRIPTYNLPLAKTIWESETASLHEMTL